LTYAAKLRLPISVKDETRRMIIEQTIQELGLSEAANTIVGGAGRKGISGGERRRLSIGCVLVSFPSVLVLDEVTTGLDSYTAYQLLETLSRLAKRGRTIILSLHQPRSDAYSLFSRILLLSHGSVIYSGPTARCLSYFANLGYEPEAQTNPLDFLIDVSSIDTRDADAEEESRQRLTKLQNTWRQSPIENCTIPSTTEKSQVPEAKAAVAPEVSSSRRPGVFAQTLILLPRSVKNMIRGYPELIGYGRFSSYMHRNAYSHL
jgi:ABC-type multidrug transport system ATPase subunit